MSPLLSDLAEHAGQLSLSIVFMGILTLVLYGETHISEHAAVFVRSLLSGWH
ncbi:MULTISPECIES: hypothetical protein [Cupriavidus]|uniref:Uncharacterized protein n=1 Tax=Cupriavidus necator TaxID=106590 RepID=A0A1U9UM02_CUPNE|nr:MULTISPECIES: hypothetical protein [Cupriavidus]AQV93205.1 hypothetical protein BJN34_04755 [Cupriavidus necator]